MAKSKSLRNRASRFVKSSSMTAAKALPGINNGLKNATKLSKDALKETKPLVEKGVGAVYGLMATGFNLGAQAVSKGVKSATKKRRGGKRRSHSRRR